LTLPSVADYYVRIQYGGNSYWTLLAAGDIAGQPQGVVVPGTVLSSLVTSNGNYNNIFGTTMTALSLVGTGSTLPAFTAPASGKVRVTWSAPCRIDSGILYLGLLNGGSQIGDAQMVIDTQASTNRRTYDGILSGLTPGVAYTLDCGAYYSGAGTNRYVYGSSGGYELVAFVTAL
jgi:hypothetical protein